MKHKILDILKGSEGYVSGEEISRSLNISRTAVWKHIKTLREDGYEISSSTNRGYRLGQSDVISPEEITAALDTGFIGRSVFCLEETDSTNSECKRHSDYPDGTVFTAEIQTGGRGRRGKEWSSPKGVGAWFSVLLKPDMRPEDVSKITLIAGLAVCRAIGCGAMIKYPNDIVIGSRKVCGILTELSAEIDAVNYIVCGIGINVNTPSFDGELQERATSLFIETGKRHSRARVIAAVLMAWWVWFIVTGALTIPFARTGFRMVVFSIIIMIVVLFFRRGIMGDKELTDVMARLAKRRAVRKAGKEAEQ